MDTLICDLYRKMGKNGFTVINDESLRANLSLALPEYRHLAQLCVLGNELWREETVLK